MKNKTKEKKYESSVSPAVRIGALVMAGLMVLGTAFYALIYLFS